MLKFFTERLSKNSKCAEIGFDLMLRNRFICKKIALRAKLIYGGFNYCKSGNKS
jgi:hypothetical protein